MDNDIEWLFEEVYRLQQQGRQIYFLSDWDSDTEKVLEFSNLLGKIHIDSIGHSFKYAFAYEQFEVKRRLVTRCNSFSGLKIKDNNLTLSPSATQSIYLTFLALKQLGVHRYLVITPAYFSTLECLQQNQSAIIYHHLTDRNGFGIDVDKLRCIIKEQFIQCMVITDPIFSSGMEMELTMYEQLIAVAKETDIYTVVDYSLGGLLWDETQLSVVPYKKLAVLQQQPKFVFIDSLSKRLQLNGIKFSIIFSNEELIDQVDRYAESIYGGLNSLSLETIRHLYLPENEQTVLAMQYTQLKNIKANYRMLQTLSREFPVEVAGSNSGFFSIVYSSTHTFESVNAREVVLKLLHEDNILAIPNNRFSYFKANKFGFRVNLAKEYSALFSAMRRAVRKVFNGLANG